MQTIYLDISNKGVIPCIQAKQNEVGRKFLAVITDSGVPYEIKNDSTVSVWYEGASGKGNYTEIGERSAISVTKNRITVELIAQMLAVPGDGVITVLINSANGDQIGLWNIDYCVEAVAGAESEKAEEYYTAFSQSAASLAQSAETIKAKQDRIDSIIKAKNATAAGLIYPLASSNVPSGFLLCDGSEYSRTEYSELFESIGTVYGDGDGSTTFNVPNLQTRVPVGAGGDYEIGDVGGEETHTLTVEEMPEHRHQVTDFDGVQLNYVNIAQGGNGAYSISTTDTYNNMMTTYRGNNQSHNIMQPYTVVNYIISTGKEVEFVVGGTGSSGGGGSAEGAVLYTEQTLTPEQQEQARSNIGAVGVPEVDSVAAKLINDNSVSPKSVWSSQNTVDKLCPSFTESGSVVTCEPVEGYPLEVVSKIELVQEGSGDPSFENIRPIVGHTAVNLSRRGKNLFNVNAVPPDARVINNGDGTLTVSEGSTGGVGSDSKTLRMIAPGLEVGKTYILSAETTGSKKYIYLKGYNKSWHFGTSLTITDTILDSAIKWYIDTNTTGTISNIQIEEGKVATAYEPYHSETITAELGQTAYGGTYNWATGELVVDGAVLDVEPSQIFYAEGETDGYAYISLANIDHTKQGFCNLLPYVTITNSNSVEGFSYHAQTIRFRIPEASDLESYRAWVGENQLQFFYKLTEPTTIQLTPQEILALQGINILSSNTGDTTVTGKADPTAIIEKLTNAIIALGGNV